GPGVVNLAAAMTYTLLVLLAGLLAKGDAGGREGRARFLLAAGIVLAPQLNPSRQYADFVVVKNSGTYSTRWLRGAAERTFGPPRQTYVVGPYTIMTGRQP